MSRQSNKRTSKPIKATIVAVASAIVMACIGGIFLIFNHLFAGNAIPVETGNLNPALTVAVTQYQESVKVLSSPTDNPTAISPIIVIPTQTKPVPTKIGALTSCPTLHDHELRIVQAGTFVIGDIVIEQIEYINNTGETTIAYLERNATIWALEEVPCYRGEKNLLDDVIQDEFQYGCGSGCTSIRFVVVPKEGPQTVEIYDK